MSGWGHAATVAVVVIIVAALIYSFGTFPDECRAHGGSHITYPYKQLPECWDADGRRVFW